MPNDELLTDDYVADLLAKEASSCSLKYSAMGMEAFNTKNKPTNLPKPNTRFLRHIIKDTDTHNKALLAKEAAESRARLKDLERAEELKRQKKNPDTRDIRRRQLGDIQSILGGGRRRGVSDDKAAADVLEPKRRGDGDGDSRGSRHREGESSTDRREDRRDHERLSQSKRTDRKSHKGSHTDEARRSRRRDHGCSSEESRRHRGGARDRSRSPRSRHRSRSPKEKRSKHRHRSPVADRRSARESPSKEDEDDSDPLEELIGPAPPPRYRGRGKIAGSADMDRRFSSSYDPKEDAMLDDGEGDNWDDAVEAYRDRQKLRMNQEDRMRAAGFADHQIQKLNAPVRKEKTEEDVVWTKAGEKREWDRGKDEDDGVRGIFSEDE